MQCKMQMRMVTSRRRSARATVFENGTIGTSSNKQESVLFGDHGCDAPPPQEEGVGRAWPLPEGPPTPH